MRSLTTVKTKYGLVSGIEKNGITRFMGIPYAAPPAGELRWKAPREPQPWEGVRKCDKPAPCCPQKPGQVNIMTLDMHEKSEDCLYLNVWTSAVSENDALPVLVYIHGGSFLGGMGSAQLFEGWSFAANRVILVTINYRLGALGFLAHPALSAESENGVSGNYGILDQIAALTWVKENIAAFGGDPERVTVAGQSAGGMSVCTLLASPLSQGLFKGACIHSGGPHYNRASLTLKSAEEYGEKFMEAAGCASIGELRAVPAEKLNDISLASGERLPFSPCIDGFVMKESVYAAFMNGRIAKVPILFGSTADEGSFVPAQGAGYGEKLEKIKAYLGEDFDEFSRLYELSEENLPEALHDSGRDSMIKNLSVVAARLAEIHPQPVYQYLFAEPTVKSDGTNLGAGHSSELTYVFNNLWVTGKFTFDYSQWTPVYTLDNFELGKNMNAYWSNFAKCADPNGPGMPYWPRYAENGEYMLLKGTESRAAAADSPQMDFIGRFIEKHQNF